jgi:hypothetical protein
LDSVSDKETRKKIEKAYDALYSSPVKSHPSLAQPEAQILKSIASLRNIVAEGEKQQVITLSDSLLAAINERNRQLKMLN